MFFGRMSYLLYKKGVFINLNMFVLMIIVLDSYVFEVNDWFFEEVKMIVEGIY